ncbi:MAG: hypothetical protein JNK15_05900 [Planctomycetes bacterium]|nr:hypothetical protein [Planctomycetota bacterium]
MAIDRSTLVTACIAIGAAGVVFAFLPGAWPVPVDDAFVPDRVMPALRASAAAVDAACARGDAEAFASATTAAHRAELQARLAVVDRALDADTLRELADNGVVDWLVGEPVAGVHRGARTAVAVARRSGDGVQVLAFEWDGRRWRFDGSEQAQQARSPAAAKAAVEAVARRVR